MRFNSNRILSICRYVSNTLNGENAINAGVVIRKKFEKKIVEGNPLLFNNSIASRVGEPKSGDFVKIYTDSMNCIGVGVYNSHSMYAVRIFSQIESDLVLSAEDLIKKNISNAFNKRQRLFDSSHTNCFRLINAEGDFLSGLVVDKLGNAVVIETSAFWCELYSAKLVEMIYNSLLSYNIKNFAVYLHRNLRRLNQDGWLGGTTMVNESQLSGVVEPVTVKENKLRYLVHPAGGLVSKKGEILSNVSPNTQKTGFYCDQRVNRLLLRDLSKDKKVLDLYCFTGGFAMNALYGGAKMVTGIDSSPIAIESAKSNLDLNEYVLSQARKTSSGEVKELISFHCRDSVDYMRELITEYRSSGNEELLYDIIVVDPPKLAPSLKDLSRARRKYIEINTMALTLLKPNGLCFSFSCSAPISREGMLLSILKEAAVAQHKATAKISKDPATRHAEANWKDIIHVEQLLTIGKDHPVVENSWECGSYLTGYLIKKK